LIGKILNRVNIAIFAKRTAGLDLIFVEKLRNKG
jgi:hypothetical protein